MIYYYLHPLKPLYMVTELLATQPQPQVMIKSTNVMQSLNKYKNFTVSYFNKYHHPPTIDFLPLCSEVVPSICKSSLSQYCCVQDNSQVNYFSSVPCRHSGLERIVYQMK